MLSQEPPGQKDRSETEGGVQAAGPLATAGRAGLLGRVPSRSCLTGASSEQREGVSPWAGSFCPATPVPTGR